jgi:predicted RNase H-like nuclease (RuvC/YqgF family)
MKDVSIVNDDMDSGMWQEAVSSLVKENNRLTEKLMLLEDTNAMLSSECRRLSDELARRNV